MFNVNTPGNVNNNNAMNAGSVRPVDCYNCQFTTTVVKYLFGYYFLVNNMIIVGDNICPWVVPKDSAR